MRGENQRIENKEPLPETLRQSFEYRDVEGRLLGRAELELESEETEIPPKKKSKDLPVRGHILKQFLLHGEKDGQPTSVDMLQLARRLDTKVLMTSSRQYNYEYNHDARIATVPPLETLTDVGIFLHELGHAEQEGEDRFSVLTYLYGSEKGLRDTVNDADEEKIRILILQIRDAIPETEQFFTDDDLEELRIAAQEIRQKEMTLNKLRGVHEKEAHKKNPEQERVKEIKEQIAFAAGEVHDLLVDFSALVEELHVHDLLALPTRIMERDATRRALSTAQTIQDDGGIAMFAKHFVPIEATVHGHANLNSDATAPNTRDTKIETDMMEDLERWLATYSAGTAQLTDTKNPYQKILKEYDKKR